MINVAMKRLAAAACFVLAAGAASASTVVYYSDFLTGDDLGSQNTAILTATQNGSNVSFSLEATLGGSLTTAGSFIGALGLTYGGTVPTAFTNDLGSEGEVVSFGTQSLSGGGISIDFGLQFEKSASGNRLLRSETALFTLYDVNLALFDFTGANTAIHIQETEGEEGSSKYGAGDCVGDDCDPGNPEVIPLPAAGWLLIAGLGGLAAMKRRRKAA